MNSPKVSVIISTYNRANLLPRAINSVLNQTFKNFELIIVDDCSTDNTSEVVKEFQKKDERIRYIRLDKNSGGPARPNNIGIKNSNGEYIAFLEHDDEWFPEKLIKQIKAFSENKSVGLVTCWAIRKINGKGKLFKNLYSGLLEKENWKFFWEKWGVISLSTVMIKRDLVDNIGAFDENLRIAADVDFYLRAIKYCDFYFINEPLIYYYEHPESQSRYNFWLKWIPEYEYLIKKFQEDFKKAPKAYSKFLKTLGTCYILKGEFNSGREYLKEAIKRNPTNTKLYLQYFLTLFGQTLYKNLLMLKRKFS